MMRSSQPLTMLIAVAALAATSCGSLHAQEFLDEPKTIAFLDRPSEELIDPDAGLIRFEEWAQSKPVEKQFLTPFPSYVEPYVEATVDGVRKKFKEKLHMYVGEARFALARPPGSIDLASLVSLPFVERIDPAIKHRLITPAEAASPKDPRAMHNQHPLRRWCEARPVTICLHSRYQFEGKLPIGIQIANKLRESARRIPDYLEFESELTLRPPAEVTEMGLASLTGIDTPPVGALEQNIFYVNQVMQFGKLLAVFQEHPADAKATVVTTFIALAVETSILAKTKKFMKVPVLRNLVPAQVLAGKSSFNAGTRSAPGCRSMRATRSRRSLQSSNPGERSGGCNSRPSSRALFRRDQQDGLGGAPPNRRGSITFTPFKRLGRSPSSEWRCDKAWVPRAACIASSAWMFANIFQRNGTKLLPAAFPSARPPIGSSARTKRSRCRRSTLATTATKRRPPTFPPTPSSRA